MSSASHNSGGIMLQRMKMLFNQRRYTALVEKARTTTHASSGMEYEVAKRFMVLAACFSDPGSVLNIIEELRLLEVQRHVARPAEYLAQPEIFRELTLLETANHAVQLFQGNRVCLERLAKYLPRQSVVTPVYQRQRMAWKGLITSTEESQRIYDHLISNPSNHSSPLEELLISTHE